MADRTVPNSSGNGYTTYHDDGTESHTYYDSWSGGMVTYHADGTESHSYRDAWNGRTVTYHDNGKTSHTYKDAFSGGYTTYHDDGSTSFSYKDAFSGGYATYHDGGGTSNTYESSTSNSYASNSYSSAGAASGSTSRPGAAPTFPPVVTHYSGAGDSPNKVRIMIYETLAFLLGAVPGVLTSIFVPGMLAGGLTIFIALAVKQVLEYKYLGVWAYFLALPVVCLGWQMVLCGVSDTSIGGMLAIPFIVFLMLAILAHQLAIFCDNDGLTYAGFWFYIILMAVIAVADYFNTSVGHSFVVLGFLVGGAVLLGATIKEFAKDAKKSHKK